MITELMKRLYRITPPSVTKYIPGPNPFKKVVADAKKQARLKSQPMPDTRYCIHFTPRSGSTRIVGWCRSTRHLGDPREIYNPAFMRGRAQAFATASLEEFADIVPRKLQIDGIFGLEMTYRQLLMVFKTSDRFMELVRPTHHFWLIREDIVLQAVSSAKMVQTNIGHSVEATADEIMGSDAQFDYRPWELRNRVKQLHWMEQETEAMFKRHNLDVKRLSYEQVNAMQGDKTLALIADHIGAPTPEGLHVTDSHQKLGGSINAEYADKFRSENRRFLDGIEESRAEMIAKLRG